VELGAGDAIKRELLKARARGGNGDDKTFTQRGAVLTSNIGNGKLLKVEEEWEGSNDTAVERTGNLENEGR